MRTAVPERRDWAPHAHYPISLGDLAQALDHSDEGFALTDPDGKYVYINEAHLRMYGYDKPQDLLGRSWRTLYMPEWVRHFESVVLPALPHDLVWRGQVMGKKRNGTSFLAGVTLTFLPDGKITCNCRDESVRREGADALLVPRATTAVPGSDDSVGELAKVLLSGLAATTRRPLHMLTGYSSFFLAELETGRGVPEDSLRAGLAEIDTTGRRLVEQMRRLDLVARLVARQATGAMRGNPHATKGDWSRTLTVACREKAAAAERQKDLCIVLDDAALTLEVAELEWVVLELLANALQSSRAGDAIVIHGTTRDNVYELRVCDEGVGWPKEGPDEHQSRPFGQASPCGCGLAVARFILRNYGASLEVDRSCTDMTCLKVTLPLRG